MLIGRYRGKGSVLNFDKKDGTVKWHAEFETVSAINAHSQDFESGEQLNMNNEPKNESVPVENHTE